MENTSKNLIPLTMTSLFPSPDSITGLTGPQKCSIYAAWQLIKKDFHIHARNVFARFFEHFPEYLQNFDNNHNGATNIRMHEHSLAVFQSLSFLIEKGFYDSTSYEQHLCYLAKVHPNILGSDVKKILDIITDYLLGTLAKQRTSTLDTALQVFFNGICHVFDENIHEMDEVMPQEHNENVISGEKFIEENQENEEKEKH